MFVLTYRVLLADVSHYPHKTIADALFISVLMHCYASPVALFILSFLIQQLSTLKKPEYSAQLVETGIKTSNNDI